MNLAGLSLSLSTPRGGGSSARTGTSATTYSVAGTRLRFPVQTSNITDAGAATLTNHMGQVVFWSPDYEITDPRFYFANYWQLSSAVEVACASSIIIDGLSMRIDAGNWIRDDTSYPVTIATGDNGGWTPALTATIPANSKITLRFAWHVPTLSGTLAVPIVNNWLFNTITGTAATSDATRADTAANAATFLSTYLPANGASGNGSTLGNGAGSLWLPPAMMIAKGGDGRPAILCIGDSILYGTGGSLTQNNYTARGEFGYIPVGLDDNAATQRIAYCNLGVPGSAPTTWGSSKAAYWAKKAAATQAVYDEYGYWPFDYVINQHGENSVPNLMTGSNPSTNLATFYTDMAAQWPGVPIVQVELIPRVTSSDLYATVANQTAAADNLYPTGDRWVFNAAAAAGGSLRTGGYISESIAAWSVGSADQADDRDKLAVAGNVGTTLSSDYTTGTNSMVTAATIPVGAAIKIPSPATGYFNVSAVAAPDFTLTVQRVSSSGSALTGAVVHEVPTGDDVHPSSRWHRSVWSAAITDWKTTKGWV